MRWRIKKCPKCKIYTIKDLCPQCNEKTVSPHPSRFSPEDKYVAYRVRMKYPDLITELEKKLAQERQF
uniref:Ribosome biogenesis protein Nop10 n=1 Tax=Ignisphaera aggregans TaxID=334771 RepID=A0A7C2VI38_9CREN